MGNIKIIKGVFDTKLELEHAGIKAGFPSPADDYRHETIDRINRMHGSETIVIGAQQYTQKNGKGKAEVFANGSISCVDKLKKLLNELSVCIHILDCYKMKKINCP